MLWKIDVAWFIAMLRKEWRHMSQNDDRYSEADSLHIIKLILTQFWSHCSSDWFTHSFTLVVPQLRLQLLFCFFDYVFFLPSSLFFLTQRITQKLLLNCFYCSLLHCRTTTMLLKIAFWGNSFNVFIIFWLIISLPLSLALFLCCVCLFSGLVVDGKQAIRGKGRMVYFVRTEARCLNSKRAAINLHEALSLALIAAICESKFVLALSRLDGEKLSHWADWFKDEISPRTALSKKL